MSATVPGAFARGPAWWRLARLGLHIVRGVLVTRLRFGRLGAAQRHAVIAAWAQGALRLLRVEVKTQGTWLAGSALIVANHVSWLDIVVIHSLCPRARFVAKSVVGGWPLIGRLVTAAGTLMVDRDRRQDTARVLAAMVQALNAGETLALFAEGTTSDGAQVLDFRASLLQCAVTAGAAVQPVALRYAEAGQALSRSVPYIGTTSFGESLWRIATAREVTVSVHLLDGMAPPHADRRALARELHTRIAASLGGAPDAGA